MLEIIDKLPEDITDALKLPIEAPDITPTGIVLGGMGGSAIGGDIVKTVAKGRMRIPFEVVREYEPPKWTGQQVLAVVVSYSGNTEEAISFYLKARKAGASIVVITSNGELENLAKKDKFPCIKVPKGYPPRGAIAYLTFPVFRILKELKVLDIKEKEFKEVIELLENSKEVSKGWAKEMAKRIKEKIPFVYAETKLFPAARRWVTQLNENSKTLAHYAVFPELDHNELNGWYNPREILRRSIVFILRSREEDEKMRKRIEITKELIEANTGEIVQVFSEGTCLLSEIFSLIQKGDYLSYYLAVEYGVDPMPVQRIETLKERMKE